MNSLPALYVWQCFTVDYEKGWLIWKERPKHHFKREADWKTWTARFSGERAGWEGRRGYRRVGINKTFYWEHRLIWVLAHGRWPAELDHINGVKDDNRLENLREVDRQGNNRNAAMRFDNASGATGVSWHKQAKKWEANIGVDERKIHLGLFDNLEDAKAARKAADEKYGFDPNHGRAA